MESVSITDGHGCDALDFCNLAGCEQMVRGETHIAGNRLDLVMTDAPDVVDVSLGTPLGTSDHCFVNCELLVEQVIAEHNISSSSRTDRWVHFQQNTVLRLFVHT